MKGILNCFEANGYPSGMVQPGRHWASAGDGYRYGFNGMEKVNEIEGLGIMYNAPFWEYESRIGRRWNIDPIIKSWESPYACFNNDPILFSDPSGKNGENSNENNTDSNDNPETSQETQTDKKQTGKDVNLKDFAKANSVGEFLSAAADKLNTGDRISADELTNFINPSAEKPGEKEVGEILGQVEYLEVKKDGKETSLVFKLKEDKKITKTIDTPNDGSFKVTIKNGAELVIKQKSATEVSLDINGVSVTKIAAINYPIPVGSIGININQQELTISVLGIAVQQRKLELPEESKK